MAYIANQQRQTYENAVDRYTPYTIATFQINKSKGGGGENPYSLYKIQANWSSGSVLVNSELYINQFILDNGGSPSVIYLPEGVTGNTDGNFPISGSTNYSKYSHLLGPDDSEVYDFFQIAIGNLRTDGENPEYYLIDVIATTPNYVGGNLIADSYCYILNTL
jgi:hypothetical protein